MDFFKTARQAAERAAEVAKAASQRGLVLAGGAAEQAAKSLNKFNIHEKIGAGHAKEDEAANQESLESVGITESFVNQVASLHFSTFRDFAPEDLLPIPGSSSEKRAIFVLNQWQLRHARLVCHAVKEMDQLRFMLCPKYMTDERFWHIYFSIMKPHLPPEAYIREDGAETAAVPDAPAAATPSFMPADMLGELKSTWHSLEESVAKARASLSGPAPATGGATPDLELTGGSNTKLATGVQERQVVAPGGASSPDELGAGDLGGLGIDPDLEAYLQIPSAGQEQEGEEGGDVDELDEDLDFDEYLNELTGPEEDAQATQPRDAETASPGHG